MENKGVKCDVCECVHNTAGCGCDRSVIEVTHDCSYLGFFFIKGLTTSNHRRKNRCFYSSFFIIGQSFFKSAFLLFDDAAQAAQLPEQPIHLPFLRRLTIKTVAAATAAAKMQIITMSAILIQKGLRRCKL